MSGETIDIETGSCSNFVCESVVCVLISVRKPEDIEVEFVLIYWVNIMALGELTATSL